MSEFRLSALAEDDLTAIWSYVAEYDERTADSQIDRIVERLVMLATFHSAGRSRDELAPGLKSFPVDRYVLFYRIIPEGIEVIRVLHGSRDVEPIFADDVSPDIGDDTADEEE